VKTEIFEKDQFYTVTHIWHLRFQVKVKINGLGKTGREWHGAALKKGLQTLFRRPFSN